jgi:IS30 family transposase
LKDILEDCVVCKKKDSKISQGGSFIRTSYPVELYGVDIMEFDKKNLVIIGVDYYTRKVHGKALKSKEAYKILEFLKDVYNKFKFKTLVSDNGKEFANELVEEWLTVNGIDHKYTVPYYHESNGRV